MWEYKTVYSAEKLLQDDLDEAGKEGWELVNTTFHTDSDTGWRVYVLIFKRKINHGQN